MQTPPPVSSDPLREAFDEWWSTPAIINALRATLTTTPSATEPDRNAARYEWLRRQFVNDTPKPEWVVTRPEWVRLGADCPSGDRLDEAIDLATRTATKD